MSSGPPVTFSVPATKSVLSSTPVIQLQCKSEEALPGSLASARRYSHGHRARRSPARCWLERSHGEDEALDALIARWAGRANGAKNVGNQRKPILNATKRNAPTHESLEARHDLATSRALHDRTGHTSGNRSFIRTAPLASSYLHRDQTNRSSSIIA